MFKNKIINFIKNVSIFLIMSSLCFAGDFANAKEFFERDILIAKIKYKGAYDDKSNNCAPDMIVYDYFDSFFNDDMFKNSHDRYKIRNWVENDENGKPYKICKLIDPKKCSSDENNSDVDGQNVENLSIYNMGFGATIFSGLNNCESSVENLEKDGPIKYWLCNLFGYTIKLNATNVDPCILGVYIHLDNDKFKVILKNETTKEIYFERPEYSCTKCSCTTNNDNCFADISCENTITGLCVRDWSPDNNTSEIKFKKDTSILDFGNWFVLKDDNTYYVLPKSYNYSSFKNLINGKLLGKTLSADASKITGFFTDEYMNNFKYGDCFVPAIPWHSIDPYGLDVVYSNDQNKGLYRIEEFNHRKINEENTKNAYSCPRSTTGCPNLMIGRGSMQIVENIDKDNSLSKSLDKVVR